MANENGKWPLPEGWEWTTLGEVTNPARERVKPPDYPDLPFIGMDDVESQTMRLLATKSSAEMKSSAERFRPDDVLYGSLRPYLNKVYRPDFEGLASAEFIVFRKVPHLESRYLQYFLNQWSFVEFINQQNTGDRPRVKFGQMEDHPFPLAPRPEQERIVAEIEKQFTRLDTAVAALERVQAGLARYKASVLKAAVEGRLVPPDPAAEPAELLLQRILAERRAKWEAAELEKMAAKGQTPQNDKWKAKYKEPQGPDTADLPELPVGWVWASWEQLSPRVTVGHVGSMKNEYVEVGIPFLRSQNVRPLKFDPEGLVFVSKTFHERLAKSRLAAGDLVVVRSGSVGVTCVIPDEFDDSNCSDLVIIKQSSALKSVYGAYYMNSVAKKQVQKGQVGVALIHFNTKSVAEMPVSVPPMPVQERIVQEVEERLSIIEVAERQVRESNARAARLRQAVLQKAFRGELVDYVQANKALSAK